MLFGVYPLIRKRAVLRYIPAISMAFTLYQTGRKYSMKI